MGGTSQSTIAAYETGAKSPTLRTIENLARSQNLEIQVTYLPKMTREDKRSLAYHRAIVDALNEDPDPVYARARKNLEKLSNMHACARQLLDQWRLWLNFPIERLTENMLDPNLQAREMRQVSPFSGVLSSEQRSRILRQFRKEYEI